MTPHDHLAEAGRCFDVYSRFRCNAVAHDYTGAGQLRETVLRHKGVPLHKLLPIAYVSSPAGNRFRYVPATKHHPRAHIQADKTLILLTVISAIKLGLIRFFRYDYGGKDDPGLVHDFLALTQEKLESSRGREIYAIHRNPLLTDDFAQAVTLGCCCLWQLSQSWPDVDLTHSLLRTAEDLPEDLEDAEAGEAWDDGMPVLPDQ
jgi:hypothetical protein